MKNESSSNVGFFGLLTLILITLKLCHVIDWGWEWVLACVWITVFLLLGILAVWIVYKRFR